MFFKSVVIFHITSAKARFKTLNLSKVKIGKVQLWDTQYNIVLFRIRNCYTNHEVAGSENDIEDSESCLTSIKIWQRLNCFVKYVLVGHVYTRDTRNVKLMSFISVGSMHSDQINRLKINAAQIEKDPDHPKWQPIL